jgi:LPXTG-motif cell wall-anchored protein
MGMFNKRNAVLGWMVWQVSKRVAKKKARDAVPGRASDSMKPNKGAIAAGLAALGGAVWFWRKRRAGDTETTSDTTS